MKRMMFVAFLLPIASAAFAQVPVIDNANLRVARKTSETTDKILETNRQVLKTAEETLKAVTGDRGNDASPLQNLAVGRGFSVSQLPSFDRLMSGGAANLGSVSQMSRRSQRRSSMASSSSKTFRAARTARFRETSPTKRW